MCAKRVLKYFNEKGQSLVRAISHLNEVDRINPSFNPNATNFSPVTSTNVGIGP